MRENGPVKYEHRIHAMVVVIGVGTNLVLDMNNLSKIRNRTRESALVEVGNRLYIGNAPDFTID